MYTPHNHSTAAVCRVPCCQSSWQSRCRSVASPAPFLWVHPPVPRSWLSCITAQVKRRQSASDGLPRLHLQHSPSGRGPQLSRKASCCRRLMRRCCELCQVSAGCRLAAPAAEAYMIGRLKVGAPRQEASPAGPSRLLWGALQQQRRQSSACRGGAPNQWHCLSGSAAAAAGSTAAAQQQVASCTACRASTGGRQLPGPTLQACCSSSASAGHACRTGRHGSGANTGEAGALR